MADKGDEDRKDVREELASVRQQLAEATTIMGNLHLRLTQLEGRVSEEPDTSQPEQEADVAPAPQQAVEQTEVVHAADIPVVAVEEPVPAQNIAGASAVSSGPDWEFLLGRNWFAIIGGIAVILGIGFFLKLAFDNNWIGNTGRIVLGVAVGLAFLAVGEYAQRKVPRWRRQ